jgi:CheY-like chemotaxis protein
MQPRLLDLNDVVTSLAKMLQRILGEDVPMHLKLHPAPLMTHSDAGMLDQVLLNLAVNARDAMPGGGELTIETTIKEISKLSSSTDGELAPGKYVCLRVSDSGCGIPLANLPRIFDPFFTTKEPGKGTGLGLATVFGIVKQHQGSISVNSEVGKGSTFEVLIPASSELPGHQTDKTKTELPRGTETILVVEDESVVRRLTRDILEEHGYEVLEAGDGVEALKVWEEHHSRVQLLLTDIVMPEGMSGLDLAARLKVPRPDLKVIFTSGYAPELAGQELNLQEGQNFLAKPSRPHQILAAVRRCLDS